jgi:ornithine carbamoyltransferase
MAPGRNLISIDDLSYNDLTSIIARGAELSLAGGTCDISLHRTVVGIYFRKPSTRTRIAFSTAALRLGAQIVTFGPEDLQTATGESIADTARVWAGMLDVIVARTAASPAELRVLGAHEQMSVVNAMSADEHPTQAIADLTTLLRKFGGIEGLRVLYIGEGNNTAAALALALSRFRGVELELRTPPGYGLSKPVLAQVSRYAERSSALLRERHDMAELPSKVDVVYTTRWQTTGTTKADPNWKSIFAPFRVESDIWNTSSNALFMHDLPAHRGEEVTTDVLDGPASIAFEQAWNKMYSAMAVLEWCRT